MVTPDTLLRLHRQLIVQKWTAPRRRTGQPGVMLEIRQLVVQLATENPTWGYTRIQGALEHLNHRVARSTIAKVIREQGLRPVPERPTSWQTFLRAHWEHLVGADFFTTEVWTVRGVVTTPRCSSSSWRLGASGSWVRRRTRMGRSCTRSHANSWRPTRGRSPCQ